MATLTKSKKSTIFQKNIISSPQALDKAEEHNAEEQFFKSNT
jgi:hypothetical protein